MTTPDATVIDPFDAATEARTPAAEYYGEIVMDAWNCVLEKGTGKRPFSPGVDDPGQRRTAIDLVVLPLPEMNLKFSLERKLVAESKAWTAITWDSLKKLGLNNAKEAKGRFCRVKLAPTGRTWDKKDAQGNLTGEKGEETTFEFLELFADEATCKAAYAAKHGAPKHTESENLAALGYDAPAAPAPAMPVDNAQKTALTFAKAIVTNLARAEKDPVALQQKVAEKIATMPMVASYYTGDSPEIMTMIMEAIGG